MDMLMGDQIAAARLRDWRKLAQGLHTRFLINDFGTGARLVVAVGVAGVGALAVGSFAVNRRKPVSHSGKAGTRFSHLRRQIAHGRRRRPGALAGPKRLRTVHPRVGAAGP